MLRQTCFAILFYLSVTKSTLTTTCQDPSGCTWDCTKSDPCMDTTYNCTALAPSCTLNCISCNRITIISAAPDFNLICVGSKGCSNMDITAETQNNHIHMITANPPTALNTTQPPTNPPTKPVISTTISRNTIIPGNIAAEETDPIVDINGVEGLLTFAGILTGMFCCCLCVGIWFVCRTKRRSKLRKETLNEYDTLQVGVYRDGTQTRSKSKDSKQTEMIQELENKLEKRNNYKLQNMHINTQLRSVESQSNFDSEVIQKMITPFSGMDANGNDLELITQLTPMPTLENVVIENDITNGQCDDDDLDIQDLRTVTPGEGANVGKEKEYMTLNTITVTNIDENESESEGDITDDICGYVIEKSKSKSVQDLISRYNNV